MTADELLAQLLKGLPEIQQVCIQSQFGLTVSSVINEGSAAEMTVPAVAPMAYANVSELLGRLGGGATRALVCRSAHATIVQAAAGTDVPLVVTVRLAVSADVERTLQLLPTLLAALEPLCIAADSFARR